MKGIMATLQIVYWRDIPAQVKARAGRERGAAQCSQRFQDAIDAAAMRAGLIGTDDYLAEWRTGDSIEREGSPDGVARAAVAELEAAYSDERLRALIANSGREGG